MEEKITFGKFIAQKRKAVNLTQKELAEKVFVTESAVSKWERGISYPDISLMSSICSVLQVTEHELVTASDDYQQRSIERQAKNYGILIKTLLWVFCLLYGISLITCLICNLAVDHTLSWFFIVLTAELTAFSLTTLPLLIKKHRVLISFSSFFISLNLLLLTCRVFSDGNWLIITSISLAFGFSLVFTPFILKSLPLTDPLSRHKTLLYFIWNTLFFMVFLTVIYIQSGSARQLFTIAYPIALVSLPLAWGMMAAIRYIPLNSLFKASICLLLSSAYIRFYSSIVDMIVKRKPFQLPAQNLLNWTEPYINGNVTLLVTICLIITAVLFAIGGILLTIKKQTKHG